jgi:hypothetical protein
MAAHASDWGDSFNQRRRGGKRLTMVMMFVGGGVVLVLDGIDDLSLDRLDPWGAEDRPQSQAPLSYSIDAPSDHN